MTRDPRDPVKPFAAAAMMGVLLARGLATEAEVAEALLKAAVEMAPRRCKVGMRVRLIQTLRDATAEAVRERQSTARAVGRVTAALAALWAARAEAEAPIARATAATHAARDKRRTKQSG